MRVLSVVVVVVVVVVLGACQSCPDGNKENSLYCHAAQCAANETDCAGACSSLVNDRDNCGACGHACGDGLACSQGQCVEACSDQSQMRCNGTCRDTTSDQANCGSCGNACTNGTTCANGSCLCAGITCAGQCIDPTTNGQYCGASGTCSGSGAGMTCGTKQACNNGTCVSTLIYRGSLPASSGHFTYGGVQGLPGAIAQCQAHFGADTTVCTYAQLQQASTRTPSETLNATDFNNAPVTDWWIDDKTKTGDLRCADQLNFGDTPWTYATAHLGNVGAYTTLTPGTGAISALVVGTPNRPNPVTVMTALCNVARFVPCCTL